MRLRKLKLLLMRYTLRGLVILTNMILTCNRLLQVVVTLNETSKSLTTRLGGRSSFAFDVQIVSSDGECAPSLSTELTPKWVHRPILEALVQPALKKHYRMMRHEEVRSVEVGGRAIDPSLKASSFLHADGSPVHVLVCLGIKGAAPAPRRSSLGAPLGAISRGASQWDPPTARLLIDLASAAGGSAAPRGAQ